MSHLDLRTSPPACRQAAPLTYAILVALGVSIFTSTGVAQQVCGKRADIIAHLKREYKEIPVARGATNGGAMFEVIASASGSWSAIITAPGGMACLVAAGEAWDFVDAEPKGEGT